MMMQNGSTKRECDKLRQQHPQRQHAKVAAPISTPTRVNTQRFDRVIVGARFVETGMTGVTQNK